MNTLEITAVLLSFILTFWTGFRFGWRAYRARMIDVAERELNTFIARVVDVADGRSATTATGDARTSATSATTADTSATTAARNPHK